MARVPRRLPRARQRREGAGDLAGALRRRRAGRRARPRRASAAFFEANFSPFGSAQRTAATPASSPATTSRSSPARACAPTRSTCRCTRVPDDLLTVDLVELFPELKDKRVRGRVDGRRVVPYWPRADIERGKAPLADKALAYVGDPIDAFFLQIQGSGRIVLGDGSVLRLNYADQNGHPYRSIARVLIDRGEMTLDRASKQAIEAWGRANPDKLPRAARRESELRVLPRGAARRRPARSTRGSTDRSARSACRCSRSGRSPSTRARSRSARRCSSRRRTRRRRHRSIASRSRRTPAARSAASVRADFFWGFGDAGRARSRPDATGGTDVAALAEGRAAAGQLTGRYRYRCVRGRRPATT